MHSHRNARRCSSCLTPACSPDHPGPLPCQDGAADRNVRRPGATARLPAVRWRTQAASPLRPGRYFSGLKLKWLIDNVPAISEARARISRHALSPARHNTPWQPRPALCTFRRSAASCLPTRRSYRRAVAITSPSRFLPSRFLCAAGRRGRSVWHRRHLAALVHYWWPGEGPAHDGRLQCFADDDD